MGPAAFAQTPPAGDARDHALEVSVLLGGSASDNIERVHTDEEDGSIATLGIDAAYEEHGARLDGKVDINAAYESYTDDTFDSEVIGGGSADFTFGIVHDSFDWVVQENFGQIQTDPFAADTPENRENINYFTTGPDFTLHLGSANSLLLSGRYSRTDYEVSDIDGSARSALAAFGRQLSAVSNLSLNLDFASYDFEDSGEQQDYDRQSIYLRYRLQGSRTTGVLDLGYTELDFGDERPDGTLARLELSRRISAAATVSVAAGSEFSQAGDVFRAGQDQGGVHLDASNVIGTPSPFERRFARAGVEFAKNRTSMGLNLEHSREAYENDPTLDRDVTTWNLYLGRVVSPTFDVRLYGYQDRSDYRHIDFEDEQLRLGVYANWRVGRMVTLRLQFDRYDRNSSSELSDYTENRGSLFVIWSPLGR